jgi:hypothetical protein
MKLFTFVFLLAGISHAGVRTVGAGGGYAEMQAVFINNQMSLLSEVCFKDPASCHLSSNEGNFLKATLSSSFILAMNSQCTEPAITIHHQGEAAIASCVLYQEGQAVAKNFCEIAIWVLTARLMTNQGLPLETAQNIAHKIFRDYTQEEQKLAVSLSESDTIFHILQIKREKNIYNIVSLEGKTSTLNLSSQIRELLDCGSSSITHWNLAPLGSQEIESTRALVEAEVEWQCTDLGSYRATLQVFFAAPQSEVLASSVQAKLVKKIAL